MPKTLTQMLLAVVLATWAGAALAVDLTYYSSNLNVNAATDWASYSGIVVQPSPQTTGPVEINVTSGTNVVKSGGLTVMSENSNVNPMYHPWDTGINFMSAAANAVNVTFKGAGNVAGADSAAALLAVTADSQTSTLTFKGDNGEAVLNLMNNAILLVSETGAQLNAADGLTLSVSDSSKYTIAPLLTVMRGGVLNVGGENGLVVWEGDVVVGQGPAVANAESGGTLKTTAFYLGQDSSTSIATATVRNGGSLVVQSADATKATKVAVIQNGTLNINADAGDVEFHGGVQVYGANAVMNLSSDIYTGETSTTDPYGIYLSTGGTLNVGTAATSSVPNPDAVQVNITGSGSRIDVDATSTLNIHTNATLTLGGIVTAGTTSIQGSATSDSFSMTGGTTTIAGSLTSDSLKVSGGGLAISGQVDSGDITISGGQANITGQVDARAGGSGVFTATGGTTVIAAGGRVDADSLATSGTARLDINGTVGEDTEFSAGGSSTVNIAAGSTFGGATGVAKLSIGGNATVNLERAVQTRGGADSFAFNGGTINIQSTGSLAVADAGGALTLGGTFNLATANGLSFNNAVTFRGGGLRSGIASAAVAMNGHDLTIGAGATLNASNGNLTITGAANFTLLGAYMAGYSGLNVTMASVGVVTGGALEVGKNATISMTSALERAAQTALNLGGAPLQILESDTANGTLNTRLSWTQDFYTYYYETRLDADGNVGLFVVGVDEVSDAAKYAYLLNAWNYQPQVAGNASRLISQQLATAIFDSRQLQVSTNYDQLNQSGKFNVDALASLLDPVNGGGYDALMLYNGSGLALANQAVLASTAQTLRRFALRNTFIRRELALAEENLDCSPERAAEILNQDLVNRLWATATYATEKFDWDQGFAGYSLDTKGITVGYDRLFGNLWAGAAFSYLGGDFVDEAALGSDSAIDTYAFSLYSGYSHPSGLFVTGALGLAYSDHQIQDRRRLNGSLGWNRADYQTDSVLAGINVGYDLRFGEYLTITPSVGLTYQSANADAHSEFFRSDDGLLAANTLNASEVKNHSTQLPLELAMSYDLVGNEDSLFTLNAAVGYAFEFNNNGARGTLLYGGLQNQIGAVPIVSRSAGGGVFNVGIGGKYLYKRFEAGMSYDYYHRDKYRQHLLTGSIGVNF